MEYPCLKSNFLNIVENWTIILFPLDAWLILYNHLTLFTMLSRRPTACSLSRAVMPKLREGEVGGFSSFHFCVLMCFVWQPPSNSLFVAITDYTKLLFCFECTRRSYCTFRWRRKVGGNGNIYWLRHCLKRDEFGHRWSKARVRKSGTLCHCSVT